MSVIIQLSGLKMPYSDAKEEKTTKLAIGGQKADLGLFEPCEKADIGGKIGQRRRARACRI